MDRKKVSRDDLRRLARAGVFTTEELAGTLSLSRARAAQLAFRLRKRGLLTGIQRGVYAMPPLETDPSKYRSDPYMVALHALPGRVVFSHASALSLLGAEEQLRRVVDVTASRARSRRRTVGDLEIRVHRTAEFLSGDIIQVRRFGAVLSATSPERTLIDLAALPNGLQDYEQSLSAFRTLLPRATPSRFLARVLDTPRATVRARVGHLVGSVKPRGFPLKSWLAAVARSVDNVSPSYFGTRPKSKLNRYDPRFKVVYPRST